MEQKSENPENPESTEKVEKPKRPEEDTWGMQEYNIHGSIRYLDRNPDAPNLRKVFCTCGSIIDRVTSWYVMIANGKLLCRICAMCNSCRLDSVTISKRLVCIDGLVLCNRCLVNFGYYVEAPFRVKIYDPKNRLNLSELKNLNNTPDAADSTPDVLVEVKRKNRHQYSEKNDNRRPIREAYYARPSARLSPERNPLFNALPYDAYQGKVEKIVCPACSEVASGAQTYVVPAMALIYHKRCFTCVACQIPLTEGVQEARKHFEFCTCLPPLVWCTRKGCQQLRMAHHANSACWLGPLRPGGRKQHDTDVTRQMERAQEASRKAEAK